MQPHLNHADAHSSSKFIIIGHFDSSAIRNFGRQAFTCGLTEYISVSAWNCANPGNGACPYGDPGDPYTRSRRRAGVASETNTIPRTERWARRGSGVFGSGGKRHPVPRMSGTYRQMPVMRGSIRRFGGWRGYRVLQTCAVDRSAERPGGVGDPKTPEMEKGHEITRDKFEPVAGQIHG